MPTTKSIMEPASQMSKAMTTSIRESASQIMKQQDTTKLNNNS